MRELTAEDLAGTPIVSELRGILGHDADIGDFRSHLEDKHAW